MTEQGKHLPEKVLKSSHNTMTLKHYHISIGNYNLVLSSTLLTLTFSWAKWSWLLKRGYFSVFTMKENIPTSKDIISDSVKWNEKGTQIERGFDKVMPLEKSRVYLDHTKFISKTIWGTFQILKTNFNIFLNGSCCFLFQVHLNMEQSSSSRMLLFLVCTLTVIWF